MKNSLHKLLSFSKKERNGITFLLILIAILYGLNIAADFLNPNNEAFDYSDFKNEIKAFEESLEKTKEKKKKQENNTEYISENKTEPERVAKEELFHFDPNNTTREQWENLGLNNFQIDNIMKYIKKGGRFYTPEDLKKIYGINQELYDELSSYIQIDRKKQKNSNDKNKKTKKREHIDSQPLYKIELNSADTNKLILVHGIGKTYARRILKYRDLLGGFYSVEQLKEVYGINDSVFVHIKSNFKVDTARCEHINLNEADFGDFVSHPYLNEYQTKAILKYRQLKGSKITRKEELLENNILPEKTYLKIANYLISE
ncbi:MAG: helix-hairpin-helix domain-containing protein [Bacteroidales bacterium]